jgi:hypothetical protein
MMTTEEKKQTIERAGVLAAEYVPIYWGCAQSAFLAIVDALRESGLEIATKEDAEEMYKGLVGLSGGFGNMGWGNCGALMGAAFAISLSAKVGRKEQLDDKDNRRIPFEYTSNTIGQKFLDEFGGVTCRDVTWKRFGKWYDSWNPVIKEEFAEEERTRGCIGAAKCTISMAARWGTEYILDIQENPLTLEAVKEKFGEVH